MSRAALVATAASVAALAAAAPAAAAPPASVPTRDSVTGSFFAGGGLGAASFVVDASSGPAGEAPSGEIQMESAFFTADLPVTCLRVRSNRAVVGGFVVDANHGGVSLALVLEDGLAGAPDKVGLEINEALFPPSCADVDIDAPNLLAFRTGSVTIVDAPVPPASKEDCRDDGWRQLGFTNRGACQRLVPHPPGAPVTSG